MCVRSSGFTQRAAEPRLRGRVGRNLVARLILRAPERGERSARRKVEAPVADFRGDAALEHRVSPPRSLPANAGRDAPTTRARGSTRSLPISTISASIARGVRFRLRPVAVNERPDPPRRPLRSAAPARSPTGATPRRCGRPHSWNGPRSALQSRQAAPSPSSTPCSEV
jgi:hypothetical protein